ncbi:hypothetical protein [Tumebacillus lipolyticus]|uniref:Uncharacterized protein n=1 Tax=Tumebacillus lipolyticus TaxID=1280370 RepID=A0ABW5A3I5_9BACL
MSKQPSLNLDIMDTGVSVEPNEMVRAYGAGPTGARCKTCRYLLVKHFSGKYFKCAFRKLTNGPGTDHRANWRACSKYEREE